MSRKERDRLKTMDQLSKGQITQQKAADWLGLTVRQVRRILRRYETQGDAGLVHRLRGKASNRRIAATVQDQATMLLKTKYADFGPTLASEHLAQDDALTVSRETVRGWMHQAGLWAGRRKGRPHRRRRARRDCFGELVQMDTSEHDWLEGRGEKCVLITMIDDATGRKLMRFAPADTTATNMALIRLWVTRWGRPRALYTDWASHFKQAPQRGQKNALRPTQIQRALEQLDIRLIAAHSPQAKGRVERSHGTDQDRLVKKLRLAKVCTIEQANRFLEEVYLAQVNRRFTVAPAQGADAHRPLDGHDLDAIFSIQEERRVANDYTVQVDGVAWQIERGEITGGLRQSKVLVERRLDGSMRLRWCDRYLKYQRAATACPLNVKGEVEPQPASAPSLKIKKKYIPSPNHPWR